MILFESVFLKHNDKIIFDNLNLHIRKNQKLLLQGKSGVGKTSLFKLLLGFKSQNKGRVIFNGLTISKETIHNIRKQIFYLSQDIDLKNEVGSILLNEICEINHIKLNPDNLTNFLELLDLDRKTLDQQTNSLSGGERQRLGLLIGCIMDRPVWLLDEPTSALDDLMKKKIADYLLNQDKTMIIVSHDTIWENYPTIRIERWA